MDFIHFSWWGDWVHLIHTQTTEIRCTLHRIRAVPLLSFIYGSIFFAFNVFLFLVGLSFEPTICDLEWTRDCILPEMHYLLLIWCAVGKCWWSFLFEAREWVCLCSFALTYEKYSVSRSNVCRCIGDTAHTHTVTFGVEMRKEYFKCLNMVRRKSYGKYLLTDRQSIARHVCTYRIELNIPIAAHTAALDKKPIR